VQALYPCLPNKRPFPWKSALFVVAFLLLYKVSHNQCSITFHVKVYSIAEFQCRQLYNCIKVPWLTFFSQFRDWNTKEFRRHIEPPVASEYRPMYFREDNGMCKALALLCKAPQYICDGSFQVRYLCFYDSAKVFLGMRPLSSSDMSSMSSSITPLLCTCNGTT
jgi:hypothetical protein